MAIPLPLLARGGKNFPIQDEECRDEDRHRSQDDQAQFPIDGEHDYQHADERQSVAGHGKRYIGEGILQGLGITCEFREQFTRACL